MFDILHWESIYPWYYFTLQLSQIFHYWVLAMLWLSAYIKNISKTLDLKSTSNDTLKNTISELQGVSRSA